MYWRAKNTKPKDFLRQYAVYIALIASVLLNALLFVARPNARAVTKEQKTNFEQFARKVTNQLLDSSYITYAESTRALLSGELAPGVVSYLQKSETLPATEDGLQAQAITYEQQKRLSSVRIDSVTQGEPNQQGLIPIEVSGVVAHSSAEETGSSGPVPFHFSFLMGNRKGTENPIVADFREG